MKYIQIILLLVVTTSCQFFETEKVSTETFYKEELKTIDWKEVDQYPVFSECETSTEKAMQKRCFEQTLSDHLRQSLKNHNAIALHDLNDTVKLAFSIANTGKLMVTNINMPPSIEMEFPLFHDWLLEGIDTLHPVAPAYKRGIPVATKFTLPIIIKTNNL